MSRPPDLADPALVRWITNIPTPYRNHRYRVVGRVFPHHDLAFEVWSQAWTEPDRPWRFTDADLDHPHRVWRGVHPVLRGTAMHANPGLLVAARRRPAAVTISAGWASFTALAAPRAARGDTLVLLESESNEASVSRRGPWDRARRVCIGRAAGYVVPGPASARLLESLDRRVAERPVLELPNIVDESLYAGVDALDTSRLRADAGLDEDRQVWLCPARLEPFKGVDTLLPLLVDRPVTLVVAGRGSQRADLEHRARDLRLDARFVGQQTQAQMVRWYALADLMVLPSRRDPNPLSPIEALAAGVPVLVSDRAGNVEEVVGGGAGWRYRPDDPQASGALVAELAGRSREDLAGNAVAARARHTERFASEPAVDRFARDLRRLLDERAARPADEGS
jgi:glycosyltransferase involved in cell wall biosynthesis